MPDTSLAAELLGHAREHLTAMRPLIPTYAHLVLSAAFPIYIAAHASLTRPSSAAKSPKKKKTNNDEEDDEDEDSLQKMEGLDPSDALMFPVMAGLTLGGLYFLIKWLQDPKILNKILSYYFSQMGMFFALAFLRDGLSVARSFIFPSQYSVGGQVYKVSQEERKFVKYRQGSEPESHAAYQSPLPGVFRIIPLPTKVNSFLWSLRGLVYRKAIVRTYIRAVLDLKARLGVLDLLSGVIALGAVAYFAFVQKPWWLTNFLGFSFSYGALQFMSPTTFWTGTLILSSLFFYDIYFVFYTPMMVTVATKLDVPIKLLFPRPPSPGEDPDLPSLAMLGLGDVVIPGMMIGLALRFDLYRYYQKKSAYKAQLSQQPRTRCQYQSATGGWGERFWTRRPLTPRTPETEPPYQDAKSFPKTYFHAAIGGYTVGMFVTLLVMQIAKHAQPALLYLVPGVLISLWGTALVRGETRQMWAFSDEFDDEDEQKTREQNKADIQSGKPQEPKIKSSTSSTSFGEIESDAVTETQHDDSLGQSKDGLPADKKDEEEKGKELNEIRDKNGDLKLISFSVTLPRKKDVQSTKKKTEAEDAVEFSKYEPSKTVDEEPATKRRRISFEED